MPKREFVRFSRRTIPADRLPRLEFPQAAVEADEPLARRLRWRERVTTLMADASRVLLVAVVGYLLFFHLSVVRGNSMLPGIHDGDRILVEPWSYVFDDIERGDVVVIQYPLDPNVDYIKRVVGLPGDRITLGHGYVWVNGELLNEPYVADVDPSWHPDITVEEGHYFVLGDNRPRSSDSREFGLVAKHLVRGRVDVRLWPPSRIGFVN